MFKKFYFVAAFLILAVFSVPVISIAQSEDLLGDTSLLGNPVNIPGSVNCFDYYRFGSVSVSVESEVVSTVSGVPLNLKGKITNENNYPIVGGSVYVKVYRKQSDPKNTQLNANILVDQFTAKDNISLAAKSSQGIVFNWKIPSYAVSGDYQIATFFVADKKFNLSGLSFTDDVLGNIFNFSVNGENKEIVEFDKNKVSINGKNHRFAAFIPKFSKDEPVSIKANLINSTKKSQNRPVTWTLYSWDGQNAANIIDTKKENIEIAAGKTKEVEYKVTDTSHPVYFLVAEADYGDTKSILDIRFARQGIDKVRLNFPGVMKYPLKAGEQNTLFTCLHNSGLSDVVNGNKLVLKLIDENNKEIDSYTYEGGVSGTMMAMKKDFTPNKNYANFSLKAELYTGDKLVDASEMKYECKNIDPKECPKTIFLPDAKSNYMAIISFAVVAILILIAVMFLKKKKIFGLGIFMAIMVCGLVFSSEKADAKTALWESGPVNNSDILLYHIQGMGVQYGLGLDDANVKITYYANITDAYGSEIVDGSNVPVGSVLYFNPEPLEDTDIVWYGTGYTYDTPYGYWLNGAATVPQCNSKDFIGLSPNGNVMIYTGFSANPANISVTHNNSTAGLSCSADGRTCTVTSSGVITAQFNYSPTYGKFYYSRKTSSSCVASDYAMRTAAGCTPNYSPFLMYACPVGQSDFVVNVPAQTINYTFSAVSTNNAPSAPVITGPNSGVTNIDYSFSATASDPDGDQIRYGFDWDNNSTVDWWAAESCLSGQGPCPPPPYFTPSGTLQTGSYQWITTGAKTFKVLAQDTQGVNSNWGSFTINIANANPPVAHFTCYDGTGIFTSSHIVSNCTVNKTGTHTPIMYLVNDSTDPDTGDSIARSFWSFKINQTGQNYGSEVGYPGLASSIIYGDQSAQYYMAKLRVEDQRGLSAQFEGGFRIRGEGSGTTNPPEPIIDCSPSSCNVKQNQALTLINNSTDLDGIDSIISSKWETQTRGASTWTDRGTCVWPNPRCNLSAITSANGGFTARLTVTDSDNNIRSITRDYDIKTNLLPIADFVCKSPAENVDEDNCLINTNGASPVVVSFDNNSTDPDGNVTQGNWRIKDSAGTTRKTNTCAGVCDYNNVSLNYDSFYTVELRVRDNRSAYSSWTVKKLTINDAPTADFDCDPATFGEGQTTNCDDNSTDPEDNITESECEVKDSSGNVLDTITCADGVCQNAGGELVPGDYNVVCTVTDEGGLTDTDTNPITVTQNQAPSAAISCSSTPCRIFRNPISGVLGNALTFDSSGSTDPEGESELDEAPSNSDWFFLFDYEDYPETMDKIITPARSSYMLQANDIIRGPGTWKAGVRVTDIHGNESQNIAEMNFEVLNDISADFDCSKDGTVPEPVWEECNPNFKVPVNSYVYIRDRSVPSSGASISSTIYSGVYVSPNPDVPINTWAGDKFKVTNSGQINIKLRSTDSAGRTIETDPKTIMAFPQFNPEWQEVTP